jgi:hypothetical protein
LRTCPALRNPDTASRDHPQTPPGDLHRQLEFPAQAADIIRAYLHSHNVALLGIQVVFQKLTSCPANRHGKISPLAKQKRFS